MYKIQVTFLFLNNATVLVKVSRDKNTIGNISINSFIIKIGSHNMEVEKSHILSSTS